MVQTDRSIDWSQLCYPGPKRPFTDDEMATCGADAPSPTLVAAVGVNLATVGFVVLQLAPAEQTARLTAALLALAVIGSTAGRWLWWRPWRRPLLHASLGVAAAMLLLGGGVRWRMADHDQRYAVVVTLAVGSALMVVMLWFLVIWRAQQIEGRLRERAEREKAVDMARRLAAAQIEPHFLFNTLASLQHWVHTADARAAPLLDALTGYLRATLPLFDRPLLPAADELLAVERYLQVMQARLGAPRLQWRLEADAAARRALLPPGLLLTLVENAIEHGVEPLLAGAEVSVRGTRQGDEVLFEVQDNGPGLPEAWQPGVGLASVRERLALVDAARARLEIGAAGDRGCRAAIRLPWRSEGPTA